MRSSMLTVLVALASCTTTLEGFQLISVPSVRQPYRFSFASSAGSDEESSLEYLTPNQIKTLRKEASKRKAGNRLPRVPYDPANLESITALFDTEELIAVSGISKDQKRAVKSVVEQLEFDLARELQREVFEIETRGFTATFYSPRTDLPNAIQLRKSYKPDQWRKREKAPRDYRGQIIKE